MLKMCVRDDAHGLHPIYTDLHIREASVSRIRQQILSEIATFADLTGMSDSRIGLEAVGDGHLVRRLRLGYGTQLGTLERLEAWMSAQVDQRTLSAVA